MTGATTVAIAIVTTGRREILSDTLRDIARQTRLPDRVGLCPAKGENDYDAEAIQGLPFSVEVVTSAMGTCPQRNALIELFSGVDIILFLDDDFYMASGYLAECIAVFDNNPDVVLVTGRVVADGVTGPGLTAQDAREALDADQVDTVRSPPGGGLTAVYNGYGCNMAVRTAPIRENTLRFDEGLPLYGWLEDVDFSRQIARFGRQVRSERCRGVHMGTKRGRLSGLRFGYSQVANPIYLWRKGTLDAGVALRQIGRNLAANAVKTFKPEPWVDRRGRMQGNLLAGLDLLLGRLEPRRVQDLQ